jgi:hypothetical protein
LSYLTEKYNLLPNNHFGARKRRSTVQALATIQEHIWEAWKHKKILSLISFDVKGAFNGVAKEPLRKRLQERQIPETLVRWIMDFCSNREASVTVNSDTSDPISLPQAGLPQGSPVSPILFIIFNANLVQTNNDRHHGAVAFVDDYTAWVTGDSREENTRKLQDDVITKTERWEDTSGATLQPEKTTFIHFTRKRMIGPAPSIQMHGLQIGPSESVKILGVIMDSHLRYRLHTVKAAKRGVDAALALSRLRGLRPESARRLFTSTVAPVVDYASSIWSLKLNKNDHQKLDASQRIAAQAITGAWKTTSLAIAEGEASLPPLRERFKVQHRKFWVNLHTLPTSHPLWTIQRQVDIRNKRLVSPLQIIAKQCSDLDLTKLEIIEAYCVPPWRVPTVVHTDIGRDQGNREDAPNSYSESMFTDASNKNGMIGLSVVSPVHTGHGTWAYSSHQNIHSGKMAAISGACEAALHWMERQQNYGQLTIYSRSQTALKSIEKPKCQSGQSILRNVSNVIDMIRAKGGQIILRWIPPDKKIAQAVEARKLAQSSTSEGCTPIAPSTRQEKLKSVASKGNKALLRSREDLIATGTGKFTRNLDQALPGKHTKQLYDKLKREESSILAQLRTGKCRLNHYLASIKQCESPACECGAPKETIHHFLLQCPRWAVFRRKLREEIGHRWGDLSFMIGGWTGPRAGTYPDGKLEDWKPNMKAVSATINFAKDTKRLAFQEDTTN